MKLRAPQHRLSRRQILSGFGAAGIVAIGAVRVRAAPSLDSSEFGIIPDLPSDQSAALQAAISDATARGLALALPGGDYQVSSLELPSGAMLLGAGHKTRLVGIGDAPILSAENSKAISVRDLSLSGENISGETALIKFEACGDVDLSGLWITQGGGDGIRLDVCSGQIDNCRISKCADSGIHAQNSVSLSITDCTIKDCGNGGIRVWRYESGPDGTIIRGNHISGILSGSGNGQNGNGINVFRADQVIVSDNRIDDCDFSAIRLNATNDCIVSGNVCADCREVAIFSEFSFSGSIISGNIVDGAATGISITNFNEGGRLAVCADNIIRNITPNSPTNPDGSPRGIVIQADTSVTGNVVEKVPGTGILAGKGPYLRNVLISNNVVRETEIGIGVSVAPDAGHAQITNNLIAKASRSAIQGMKWDELAGSDLASTPDQFDHVTVAGNQTTSD